MIIDTDIVSGWFVVNAGRVYARCPSCQSPRIVYHKVRTPGLKGISTSSCGISPACVDCGKSLPTQLQKEKRPVRPIVKNKRAR